MRSVKSFAFALVLTYEFAYHTVTLGLSPFQLVVVGVVLESMTFLCEIPTGMFADLVSRRLSVILGIVLCGGGFLFEILSPSFAGVLVAQVLWGIGLTFFSGAEAAWITDEIGTERVGSLFLRATQLGQVLTIIGTFLGAILASASVSLPIIVGACLCLFLGIVLSFTMTENGFGPTSRVEKQSTWTIVTRPLRDSFQLIQTHSVLWLILLLGIVIGVSLGAFDRLHTPHFFTTIGLPSWRALSSVSWLGIINGVISVLSLLGMEIVRRRYQTIDQLVIIKLLVGLYCGMLVGSFLFALTNLFTIGFAGFCLTQTCRNVSRPLLLQWVNLNAPQQSRATVISTYWQANALGNIAGTPVLGWLATTASLRTALSAGTLVYITTIPILLIAQRRWKRAQQVPMVTGEQ
ncbi:MFS transporter [Nostoc sp. CHAB 5784]|nr:MFS transporter [Nostoc mirabile CHAB5784]